MNKRDNEALKFEAAVLFIREKKTIEFICKQLKISRPVLDPWIKDGRWSELRPHQSTTATYNFESFALYDEASVLYIKHGKSIIQIKQQIDVSMQTLSKWKKEGQWDKYRPDMSVLTEYKAAHLYINENLTTGEIAQKLSIPELTVKYWIDLNGWEAAKLVSQAKGNITEVVANFCSSFKAMFPGETTMIEFAQNDYLKSLNL